MFLSLSCILSSSFVSELETDPLDALSLLYEDEELIKVSGVRISITFEIDLAGVVNDCCVFDGWVGFKWSTGGFSRVGTGMVRYFFCVGKE